MNDMEDEYQHNLQSLERFHAQNIEYSSDTILLRV